MKGTIQRGHSPEEDQRNRALLLASEKDHAELLMTTDLMRNDLGRVSETGTVVTEQIGRCEAYENVYHLISIIRSHAKPSLHPLELLRACFPGGSISGCPKIRAMEVIYALEKRARGIYTGSIGYINGNGDFDFNIAIRTCTIKNSEITVQLGGAIVADSDPHLEFEETLHKGKSIFKVLGINDKIII